MHRSVPKSQSVRPVRAYLELLHPAPVVAVVLAATGFTAVAAQGWPPTARLGLFLLSLLLTQFAISVHNDYCDRALDAESKPWRVLPRGLLRPETARLSWIMLALLGLLVAAPLGLVVVLLVGFGTSAGLAYNAWFKRTLWTWVPYCLGVPTLPLCAFIV